MTDEEEQKPETPAPEEAHQEEADDEGETDPALEELRPFWEKRVEAHPPAW